MLKWLIPDHFVAWQIFCIEPSASSGAIKVEIAVRRVRAPILVAHGRLDRTAHPDDALQILRAVASPERELLWLPNSGHVLPVDYDSADLVRRAGDFLTRSRPPLRYVAGSETPETR